jgi:hypothetical protein
MSVLYKNGPAERVGASAFAQHQSVRHERVVGEYAQADVAQTDAEN